MTEILRYRHKYFQTVNATIAVAGKSRMKVKCPILISHFGVFLLFNLVVTSQSYQGQRSTKFVSISLKANPNYLQNVTQWIENGALNVDFVSVQELTQGLMCYLDLQIRIKDSTPYQTLFTYNFNVCKLMNEIFRSTLLRIWFNNVLKYGNFMENCPIVPEHYYLRNLVMEPLSIPVYLVAGDYRLIIHMFYGKRRTVNEILVSHLVTEIKII